MEPKKLERRLFYMTLVLIFAAYVALFVWSSYLPFNKLSYLIVFVLVFEVLFFWIHKKRLSLVKEMKVEYDRSERTQEQKKLFMYSRIAMFSGFFTIPAYMREKSPIFMFLSAVFMILAMVLNDEAERRYPLIKRPKKGKKR